MALDLCAQMLVVGARATSLDHYLFRTYAVQSNGTVTFLKERVIWNAANLNAMLALDGNLIVSSSGGATMDIFSVDTAGVMLPLASWQAPINTLRSAYVLGKIYSSSWDGSTYASQQIAVYDALNGAQLSQTPSIFLPVAETLRGALGYEVPEPPPFTPAVTYWSLYSEGSFTTLTSAANGAEFSYGLVLRGDPAVFDMNSYGLMIFGSSQTWSITLTDQVSQAANASAGGYFLRDHPTNLKRYVTSGSTLVVASTVTFIASPNGIFDGGGFRFVGPGEVQVQLTDGVNIATPATIEFPAGYGVEYTFAGLGLINIKSKPANRRTPVNGPRESPPNLGSPSDPGSGNDPYQDPELEPGADHSRNNPLAAVSSLGGSLVRMKTFFDKGE